MKGEIEENINKAILYGMHFLSLFCYDKISYEENMWPP